MSGEVWRAGLTIVFGALAGGLTNTLAIWMLFRPHSPPRPLGRPVRWLQGTIPRNQERLAAALGHTVGAHLLTPDDLARILKEPDFRKAFDERLQVFLEEGLRRHRGTLADTLPEPVADELQVLLNQLAGNVLDRLDEYIEGEEFPHAARHWVSSLTRELDKQPLGDFLAQEDGAGPAVVSAWVKTVLEDDKLEWAVGRFVDRTVEEWLQPGRTFHDLLPQGFMPAVERAIAGYLPVVLENLNLLLARPETQARMQEVVRNVLERFLHDLRFHQRLVAALIITPQTVDRILNAVEKEGAATISEALFDPDAQLVMATGLGNAVADFLRQPVTDILGDVQEPAIREVKDTLVQWAIHLLRSERANEFLTDRICSAISVEEQLSWDRLFSRLPPESLADTFVAMARTEDARSWLRNATHRGVNLLMNKPLGQLENYLPAESASRAEAVLSNPLWDWLHQQVPPIAQRVEIGRRVEQEIKDFPMPRLESMVRGIAGREIRLIVMLGYLLGGAIGLALVGLQYLLP